MSKINILNSETIDKIAAGEVIERPLNVVKELVENSIDSNATSIHVEIKDGGVSLIRITDNGCGISSNDIEVAFSRHATSKIQNVNDLMKLDTLGFRGEALSSIAAISMLTCVSKTDDELVANLIEINGGKIVNKSQVGAPNGTTFIIKDLFYNIPVRRSFLKSHNVEAAAITDLMEQLALSNPKVAFEYTINNKQKFYTSGKGDVKEAIYNIYGLQVAKELLPISYTDEDIEISGFIGLPSLAKANRSSEHYFVNGRFVKSKLLSTSIEEGYFGFLMQHRYPFTMLFIDINPMLIDVNIHPSKMDIKFVESEKIAEIISQSVKNAIKYKDIIPEVKIDKEIKEKHIQVSIPEPFEVARTDIRKSNDAIYNENIGTSSSVKDRKEEFKVIEKEVNTIPSSDIDTNVLENSTMPNVNPINIKQNISLQSFDIDNKPPVTKEQMTLFDDEFLSEGARKDYEILGQLFLTYWLVAFKDKLYIMDQHAAHEKVKYERFVAQLENNAVISQNMLVPIITTLNAQEEEVVNNNLEEISKLGYIVEHFGGKEYSIRAVPCELYGANEEEAFREIVGYFIDNKSDKMPSSFYSKCASLGCKAAVKGNTKLNVQEVEALFDDLIKLDNPYHCPHGRPTIITITKYELEKKFKRII